MFTYVGIPVTREDTVARSCQISQITKYMRAGMKGARAALFTHTWDVPGKRPRVYATKEPSGHNIQAKQRLFRSPATGKATGTAKIMKKMG